MKRSLLLLSIPLTAIGQTTIELDSHSQFNDSSFITTCYYGKAVIKNDSLFLQLNLNKIAQMEIITQYYSWIYDLYDRVDIVKIGMPIHTYKVVIKFTDIHGTRFLWFFY